MTLETAMYGYLERDEAYDVGSFGGLDIILSAGAEIGQSDVAELFLDLVIPFHEAHPDDVESLIADIIENVADDFALLEIATRIARLRLTSKKPTKRIFSRFLELFSDRDRSYSVRKAALRGAWLSGRGRDQSVTRLSSRIIELEGEKDRRILSAAARVAGVILAERDDGGLVEFLRESEDPDSHDQFQFELGLLELKNAFQARSSDDAVRYFRLAHENFSKSYELRDSRYEAHSFALAIELLMRFFDGVGDDMAGIVTELHKSAFAYEHYVVQGDPDPLFAGVAVQAAAFSSLALRLPRLSTSLRETTWLHAADVVKNQLLIAYSANCMLNFESGEGADLLTRPVIEAGLLSNHMFQAAVQQWLVSYGDDIDPEAVKDIRSFFKEQDQNPTGADVVSLSVSALTQRLEGQRGCTEFLEIMQYRLQRGIDSVSPFVVDAVQQIHATFSELEDFNRTTFRVPFLDISMAVIEFAAARLDSSYEVNKQVAYLFRSRNSNPVEGDLQQDFHNWVGSIGVRLEPEPKGVAGGRGDLRYDAPGCRIYIEAKQEGRDATFEALVGRYGSQTTQYQATSAKLGIMLVLDKTRDGQPPYPIQDAYKPMVTIRDGRNRGVLIVRIPALRPTPHEASR